MKDYCWKAIEQEKLYGGIFSLWICIWVSITFNWELLKVIGIQKIWFMCSAILSIVTLVVGLVSAQFDRILPLELHHARHG